MKTTVYALLLLLCFASPAWAQRYQAISITSPAEEEMIYSNEGIVEVTIRVVPALDPKDKLVVFLDENRVAESDGKALVALKGVERGEHTLRAAVVDAGGGTLLASKPVKFFMWQASRLFPQRPGQK